MSAFDALERSGWERAAAAYGDGLERATAQFAAALADAAGVGPGDRVVDVATGPGTVAAEALRRGARVLAVDRSPAMLAAARSRHPGLETLEADARALPLQDASADAILAGFYLNHVDDPPAAVRELRRVLRPGGRLAVAIWDEPTAARHNGLVDEAVAHVLGATPAVPAPARPLAPTAAALGALLAAAGLDAPAVTRVAATLEVAGGRELVALMRGSTARTAAVIDAVPDGRLADVVAEVERRARPFAVDGRLAVPVPALLAAATRP